MANSDFQVATGRLVMAKPILGVRCTAPLKSSLGTVIVRCRRGSLQWLSIATNKGTQLNNTSFLAGGRVY